jgi:aminoglycoside phosphotransferase family enzyme/predicted kinase
MEPKEDSTAAGLKIEELLCPAVFPHPITHLELRETHVSWVILTGSVAYKIKKPLKLDFLDASTLARRRALCEEEIRLNRRLAPELYAGVVAITMDAAGLHMVGSGQIVEYAVRMKQFDASQELPALLAQSQIGLAEVAVLAERLAEFHVHAATAPAGDAFDYIGQLRNSVLGNLATLLSHLDPTQQFPEMGLLVDWTHDSLHTFAARFRKRQEQGFVRECHGDLHAHNIVRWKGRLTPFDCLEFDPKLRWIDVMNDVAFLVMDFVAHARADLAAGFLSRYVEQTGDYAGIRLLPFYAVYRALVRAMVDALGAEQRPAQHRELYERLRCRVRTAADFMQAKSPSLLIMHGPSGSGKSWLSELLVPLIPALRIRSDLERKRLAPPPHDALARQGNHTAEMTRRTYARLALCAESCLLAGVNTIVDATFLDREDRRQFRELAGRLGVSFVIVSCRATEAELARRIAARRTKNDPSDADLAILDQQLRHLEPLPADEDTQVIHVDTMAQDAVSGAVSAIQARAGNLRTLFRGAP